MPFINTTQVEIERHPDRILIRLARPERSNALDLTTLAELVTLLEAESAPVPLILTGAGAGFSVGTDVRESAHMDPATAAAWSRLGQLTVAALEHWPSVTVVHLHGWALGPALELALACDVLVGSTEVRLGLPGLAWGLLPGLGGLRRLAGRVPAHVSLGMFLRGEVLNGRQALKLGLLDRLIPHDDPLDQLVSDLREFPRGAVTALRELRLQRLAPADPEEEIRTFVEPFVDGECQRRLRLLME